MKNIASLLVLAIMLSTTFSLERSGKLGIDVADDAVQPFEWSLDQ